MAKIIKITVGEMMTNCYLLESAGEIAVIDPGFEPKKIVERIEEIDGKVKYIIQTHGHIDHIGAVKSLKNRYNPEILIHHREDEFLSEPEKNLSILIGDPVSLSKTDVLLHENDIIKIGKTELKVLHTPGHTPGSICLLHANEKNRPEFVFTGDTLFLDSIGRTDFPFGSEREILASIRRLAEELNDETMLYPGHGEMGLFGIAKQINPFLQFE